MRAPGTDGERTGRDGQGWVVHEGDCLAGPGGLAGLGDRSVDVVITDPPSEEEHTPAHTPASGSSPALAGSWRSNL
jgi:hypothetical protein